MSSLRYQQSFPRGLFGKYRKVAAHIPPNSRILEVGCHSGAFSLALLELGHQVVGLEIDEEAADAARAAGVPVRYGDVEDPDFVDTLGKGFDLVLLMDVLEHLLEPVGTLKRVGRLLDASGRIVITGPNVAHVSIRKELVLGRWTYTDGGILDRDHLRFYTGATWCALVEEAGFRVVSLETAEARVPWIHHLTAVPLLARISSHVDEWASRLAPRLFTVSYLIVATPPSHAPGSPRHA